MRCDIIGLKALFIMIDLFDFKPGEVYHITVGNIGNTLFLAINDRLALSLTDPVPIDVEKYDKVGFETFCTKVKYYNLKLIYLGTQTIIKRIVSVFDN